MFIKSFFIGWIEADLEHVKKWIDHIWKGSTAMNTAKKIDYINSRLQGIEFKGYENNKPIVEEWK